MAEVYEVVKGDSLWKIAEEKLGSGTKWKQLAAINGISTSNPMIYIGQKIYLSKDDVPSSTTKTNTKKAVINHFGLQSDTDNTLFATWTWSKEKNTDKYQIKWEYYAGKVWFVGTSSSISVDENDRSASRQSTYSIPSNASKVRFKVRPIAKTTEKDGKKNTPWTAEWSDTKTYTNDTTPPLKPPVPDVKIEDRKLTATLDNLNVNTNTIEFQIVKNNKSVVNKGTATAKTGHVSYSYTVSVGSTYKVRCRSRDGDDYSEWSEYSSEVSTAPATPAGFTKIRAKTESSVYLEWKEAKSAKTYEIEYAKEKAHLDGSDATNMFTVDNGTHYEKTGLDSGIEYFFRLRAKNDNGESGWSGIKSVVIGKDPAAPTTWSSTTTAVTGEEVVLYWIHNSEDGSSQVKADLELDIGGTKNSLEITNTTNEDEKDKTSTYVLKTSSYTEGTVVKWRVRTYGVTGKAGDWSTQRSIEVYAKPTLGLNITNKADEDIETVTTFPVRIECLAGPSSQTPIGYHIAVIATESYETTDAVGNVKMVSSGDEVYSKYFDINTYDPRIELSANSIDLENNVKYTVTGTVSMDSGLTATTDRDFRVSWTDLDYEPNAEITFDNETYVAHIRPYCERYAYVYHKVLKGGSSYVETDVVLEDVYGTVVSGAVTNTGEEVYQDAFSEEELYYCIKSQRIQLTDVLLSVYRREFDGSFVEIATDLDGASNTHVTDPHPALDYARYRIIAKSESTGAVSYFDVPGYPVGCTAVIIQWDEDWSSFETTTDDPLAQPAWAGSLLRLPYNIDVSDNSDSDVSLVKYIGRPNPVSYYGTQRGKSATWNVEIDKNDKETLYGLRRLDNWMGDVYVREPSGSGYWANVKVSFSQKHKEVTIPVTLEIKRVEGGM